MEAEYIERNALRMGADAPLKKPFTLDITDSLFNMGSQADEIAARLYQLRDRLFGAEPVAGTNGPGNIRGEPSCFADAARSGISALGASLARIDQLSAEIANRL